MIAEGHLKKRMDDGSKRAMIIGMIAAVVAVVATFMFGKHQQFYQSYLQAYIFVFGLAGGSLILLMIHHVAGGRWGFITRGIMEAGVKTIPLTALLFIPIIFGMGELYYKWINPETAVADKMLREEFVSVVQGKSWYLNQTAFIIRAFIYFAVFIFMGHKLHSLSRQQSETGDITLNRNMRVFSGGGIVVYILLMTVAGWDWTMSLEPAWFSSMWGPWFFVCQALTAFGMMILVLHWLSDSKPISDLVHPSHYHDLGNYCFAGIILWTYMSFSQFTIIWHANLGEEIMWYMDRKDPTWQAVAIILVLFHFVVPFLLLLSRFSKLKGEFLVKVVVFILFMRLVDNYWIIAPTFHHEAIPHYLDFLLPVALGGIWLGIFLRYLKQTHLVAKHDPRFQEDLNAGGQHGH